MYLVSRVIVMSMSKLEAVSALTLLYISLLVLWVLIVLVLKHASRSLDGRSDRALNVLTLTADHCTVPTSEMTSGPSLLLSLSLCRMAGGEDHRRHYVCPYCKTVIKKVTQHFTRRPAGNSCVAAMEAEGLGPCDVSARERERVSLLGARVVTLQELEDFRLAADPARALLDRLGIPVLTDQACNCVRCTRQELATHHGRTPATVSGQQAPTQRCQYQEPVVPRQEGKLSVEPRRDATSHEQPPPPKRLRKPGHPCLGVGPVLHGRSGQLLPVVAVGRPAGDMLAAAALARFELKAEAQGKASCSTAADEVK